MAAQLAFASDYMEGAHPAILKKLAETNLIKSAGYGLDEYSETAREKIRKACNAPEAEVHFLVGGTQTNATVIGALLASYQGVVAAETGHVSSHEAGAIEAGGHKVLTIPQTDGKISAEKVEEVLNTFKEDGNRGRKIFVMGHPEYDRYTLDEEYKRDLQKGMDIAMPENYYPDNDINAKPLLQWRSHGNMLYANWLNYYVYQQTPYDYINTRKIVGK